MPYDINQEPPRIASTKKQKLMRCGWSSQDEESSQMIVGLFICNFVAKAMHEKQRENEGGGRKKVFLIKLIYMQKS